MNNYVKPTSVNIALHILIWSMVLLLPYLVSSSAHHYSIGAIPGSFFTLAGFIHMVIFYGNAFYLYPKLFNKRSWWLYIVLSAILLIGSFQLKYFILANWYPDVAKDISVYKFIFPSSIVVFAISLIYRSILNRIHFEREQKDRQAQQLITELKFLRSQISPHFLFNVLTNMVALARKGSDQLEHALITLADLMRYMLYDTQGKKVELRKEVEYLNSYIALQKLRFGNDVQINCDIIINPNDNSLIEPMLLIPFVENAFKHGVGHIQHPQIDIKLNVVQGSMTFEVLNRYNNEHGSSKDDSSGIGLDNVRLRLGLLYKDRYQMLINDQNNLFHTTLILPLT